MGVMIQICEEDIEELAEEMDGMLHVGGRIMSCIEQLREGSEKSSYGRRMGDGYGRRSYGRRREEDTEENDTMYGNRRSRDAYGRYM